MAPPRQETDGFVARPDEHEEVGTELYCWMPGNMDRECNGSCVAYHPSDEADEPAAACKVLGVFRMIGAASQIFARDVQQKAKSQKRADVSKLMGELPDPPEVR